MNPVISTLGSYIKERRTARGINQETLGDMAGVSKAYISQVENGRVTLPSADIRRRIAKALGVTHVELLIAAGELLEDEIATAGVVGVVHHDPNDPRQRLHRLIDDIAWTSEALDFVEGALDRLANPPPKTTLLTAYGPPGSAYDSR
jgi:transcriptional regulator with XRE-family HTH domain